MPTPATPKMKRGAKINALLKTADKLPKINTAIVCPETKEALGGAILATNSGYINPVLFGNKKTILNLARELNATLYDWTIIEATHEEATYKAIALVHEGKIDVLMKGSLHTDQFMTAIISAHNGLRTNQRMSNIMIADVPAYHKILSITDCVLNINPNFLEKKTIIENAIDLERALNIPQPKIALLAAIETPSEKIPVTLEWQKFKEMGEKGEFGDVFIDGPLSLDLAISKSSADCKRVKSVVAGDADILIVPELNCGNVFFKTLHYFADGLIAGIIVGAKIPIILTSRSADAMERAISCQLARFYSNYLQQK